MRPQIMLSASLLAAGLALPLSSVSYANVVISIDKSTQRMLVAVDGATRYDWAVSTGRPGYDTPNGTFKPNRMEAEHFSKEYENAPMPHSIFFDMAGHAIHGFSDVPHLGLAVSHGCVRLSPDHAATLYSLVQAAGMANTAVIVSGHTPAGRGPIVAQRRAPTEETAAAEQPMPIAPAYGQRPAPYYGQPYYQQYGQRTSGQIYYDQYGRAYYRQPVYARPVYRQPQPQYARPFTLY
jgi:L,D-transpeptidase catalytic domain